MDAESPRFRFGLQLVGLARRWRRELDRQLAAAGLTDATWAPLVHLQVTGDGMTQTDLAALVGIEGSSLVRLLDALADKGLIERRAAETDRRAKLIVLTDAGHAAVAGIRRVLARSEAAMLGDLSEAELAAMLDGFHRVDQSLRRMQGERGPHS